MNIDRETRRLNQATHKRAVTHERCEIPYCPICEGGLFMCADCGAAEIEAEEQTCEERQTAKLMRVWR